MKYIPISLNIPEIKSLSYNLTLWQFVISFFFFFALENLFTTASSIMFSHHDTMKTCQIQNYNQY